MKVLFATILVVYYVIETTHACTEFVLPCQDRTIIIGRTNMFSHDFNYDFRTAPKGTPHQGREFPTGSSCYGSSPPQWKSVASQMYITPREDFLPEGQVDGQNSDGLSVGVLYFSGYAQYTNASEIPIEKCGNAISQLQLGEYILTRYSNTQEVRDAIKNDEFPFVYTEVSILPNPEKPGETMEYIFPLHWSVVDRTGDALVIEYTEEGQKIHHNTIGVFTNTPTYDWHMSNLKNYVSLQNEKHPVREYDRIDGKGKGKIVGLGRASGGFGMPGDFTTTSRFVRTAAIVQFGEKPEDAKSGAIKAWQILNASGVPNGSGGSPVRWAVVKDLANNVVYFQDQHFMSIRKIDLKKASKTRVERFLINDDFMNGVLDITTEMEPLKTKIEL